MSKHIIAHVEIPSTDLERTKEFLNKLFQWDLKPFGNNYLLYNTTNGTTIGVRMVPTIAKGNCPSFHILVDNIERVLDLVPGLGGKIFKEKAVIPVYGWYALINDPDGNIIGLYEEHQL